MELSPSDRDLEYNKPDFGLAQRYNSCIGD
jgi:hypothetical protein